MRSIFTKFVLLALSLSPLAAASNQTINPATQINWPKVTGSGAPSGGACTTNYGQPYTQTTGPHYFVCTPTGWFQVDGGGGGGPVTGSGTTGYLPAWTSTTSLGNSHIDDGITTASTLTSTEPFAVNDGSGKAGAVAIKQGTAQSNSTTSVTLTTPTSVTSYRIVLPGVAPTSGNTFLSCTATDPAVCTWAAGGGGGSGYTNLVQSNGETTVAQINTACSGKTYYATTPLSIATGGTITCPYQATKAGVMTVASGQTVTFTYMPKQTDGGSQIFAGTGSVVLPAGDVDAQWFGWIADGNLNSNTGTDNTNAWAAVYAATTKGRIIIPCAQSKFSAAGPVITKDGIWLSGACPLQKAPAVVLHDAYPMIFTASSSATIIDFHGSDSAHLIEGDGIENIAVSRFATPGSGAIGINVHNTGAFIAKFVMSNDSNRLWDLSDTQGHGIGGFFNVDANLGYGPAGCFAGNNYGYYLGQEGVTTHINQATFSGNCAQPTYGVYWPGEGIDYFIDHFEFSHQTYGTAFGSAGGFQLQDVHITNPVIEAKTCFSLSGGSTVINGTFTIDGGDGYCLANTDTAVSIDHYQNFRINHMTIQTGSVTLSDLIGGYIEDLRIKTTGSTAAYGIQCTNCNGVNMVGNYVVGHGSQTGMNFVNVDNSPISGNVVGGTSTGTGMAYDAASTNNPYLQLNTIGGYTTPFTDAGTGNQIAAGSISGATTGQALIAGSSTSATSSKALAGSGAGLTTGPTSAGSGNCVQFTGSGGQIADSGSACGGGGGASFPFTVIQEQQFALTSNATTYTIVFPQALQSSGATAWIIIAADGNQTITFPSGWTVDINQAQSTYSRIAVLHVASAGQTQATFTTSSVTNYSSWFIELSGTRTLDTSAVGGQANSTQLIFPAITPSANALVIGATCIVSQSQNNIPNPIFAPYAINTPFSSNWRPFFVGANINGQRELAGFISSVGASNVSTTPPALQTGMSLFASGGMAYTTFSIK